MKVIIRGNHDYWWNSLSKVRSILPPSIEAVQHTALSWNNISISGTRFWDPEDDEKIFEREMGRLELACKALDPNAKMRIIMTHYPPIGLDMEDTRASRLFERLREKKALCYEISSSAKSYKETGNFVIHAGVGNKKLYEASKEIIHELVDIKEKPVSSDELYRAKEYYRGQFLLALESTAMRMLWLGERIMTERKAPPLKEIFKNINKVSAEDIRKAAGIIFTDKNLNFATVGPAGEKDKNKLKKVLNL